MHRNRNGNTALGIVLHAKEYGVPFDRTFSDAAAFKDAPSSRQFQLRSGV